MMGLAYNELYSLTPRSFNNKLEGFSKFQEQKTQNAWDQTRIILLGCLTPHSKKKLKPTDILPFPWDGKSNKKKVIASPEQIKVDVERHKELLKKLNKN